eukprot:TRINITY_DN110910_c0_g1_i1.p1 TRINITY_DN110910_c0_g1~~TRINITY_DN110910_c0_g1_i1.p1  ORF type:complete len:469 (+),score=95.29 TRINITY_DN110910_c0_g1_i1:116-1522(+)
MGSACSREYCCLELQVDEKDHLLGKCAPPRGRVELHPVMQAGGGICTNIRFVRAEVIEHLATPWPRRQEMPENYFQVPTNNDFVAAVSHGWRHQAHPDAMGDKSRIIRRLFIEAEATNRIRGKAMCFYDFMSVTQRPFRRGQQDRTDEEAALFGRAIGAMPQLYFYADAVLHVSLEENQWSPVDGEGMTFTVPVETLDCAVLMKLGDDVRVVGFQPGFEESQVFGPMDRLVSIDGHKVTHVSDVARLRNRPAEPPAQATLEFAPFGKLNKIPAGEKGWVFLERFCSMVKVAMLDSQEDIDRAIFSNDRRVIDEIKDGACQLRQAARRGKEDLQSCLNNFMHILAGKKFASLSVDKSTNTGGCGGLEAGVEGAKREELTLDGDAAVVARIMRSLCEELPDHWEHLQRMTRQRYVLLALSAMKSARGARSTSKTLQRDTKRRLCRMSREYKNNIEVQAVVPPPSAAQLAY